MSKKILKKIHHYTIPHEGNDYKPHSLRHKTLLFYSALLIMVKVVVVMAIFLSYPSSAEFSTITTNRIIELTNKVRFEQGLASLETSQLLNQAASLKLKDMFAADYFAHNSPGGVNPWHWFKEVGYNYTYAGENLAMNFIEAEDTIDAWMASPTHRDNMISDNYNEIGVAVGIGTIEGRETTVVVQLFGKRFVRVAGEETFVPMSQKIKQPTKQPSTLANGGNQEQPAKQPVVVTEQAGEQQVTLAKQTGAGWLVDLIKYSSRFFFVLMVFIVINLLLTIFIRREIQHKPIIMHSIIVIFLAIVMILWKVHFIEGMDGLLVA